jgi:hypothetical protein
LGFVKGLRTTRATFQGGWRAILVSLAVLPEIFLDAFLDVVYVICLIGAFLATDEAWGRVRQLDPAKFDRTGRPLDDDTRQVGSALRGTHNLRRRGSSLAVAVVCGFLTLDLLGFAVYLPLTNLRVAWIVIAAYVLIGSLATLGRLVPVRTF